VRVAVLGLIAAVIVGGASAAAAAPGSTARNPPAGRSRSTQGRFLVATDSLQDPNFSRTVILMLSHEAGGAMGVIINRPSEVRLTEAVPALEDVREREDRLYFGGPVALNLMIVLLRSTREPAESRRVFEDVYVTGSLTALKAALARKGKAERVRAFVGHAGWAPGQLENEIARGDWRVVDADPGLIFDTPPRNVWPALNKRTGGEWTRRDGVVGEPVCAAAAGASRPSLHFQHGFDFHGDIEGQFRHADGRSGMATRLAEDGDEQVGAAVDHCRRAVEAGRAIHHSEHLHHLAHAVERSENVAHGRQQRQRRQAGRFAAFFGGDRIAHLAAHDPGRAHRPVSGDEEQVAHPLRANVRAHRPRHGGQLQSQLP